MVLVSPWFGGLAWKYRCPEEKVWWQQTQYQGPWHCWLFRLQVFPQLRRHSQHEALAGWQAHLRLNWAAGVQAGVLVGIGTGRGQGFGWLLPGHPGFSSNSKPIWPWMPTTGSHSSVPTWKCRLPSPLCSASKTRGAQACSGPSHGCLTVLFSWTAALPGLLCCPAPSTPTREGCSEAPTGDQSFQRPLNSGETRERPVRGQVRKVQIIL